MKTLQFERSLKAQKCIDIVKNNGAVLLKNYVELSLCQGIIDESQNRNLQTVDERNHRVRQQFETINCSLSEATPKIRTFGRWLVDFVGDQIPEWKPNDVALQRYHASQTVGIDPHRDYARDKLLVAVATLQGEADFHIELDNDEGDMSWYKVLLQPGDLVLLRGPELTGAEDDRPYHQIDPPYRGQRISLALRHNVRLETNDDQEV